MDPYAAVIETMICQYYQTLSEKDRRRYAAVEALKLGRGGISYIARVVGCSRSTILEGVKDLEGLPEKSGYEQAIRRPGGGRKRYADSYPTIDEWFLKVLQDHTAGDPMDDGIRWTNLSRQKIADLLAEQYGVRVSVTVIKQLLKKHNYRLRQAQKK